MNCRVIDSSFLWPFIFENNYNDAGEPENLSETGKAKQVSVNYPALGMRISWSTVITWFVS